MSKPMVFIAKDRKSTAYYLCTDHLYIKYLYSQCVVDAYTLYKKYKNVLSEEQIKSIFRYHRTFNVNLRFNGAHRETFLTDPVLSLKEFNEVLLEFGIIDYNEDEFLEY